MFDYITLLVTILVDGYLFFLTARLFITPKYNLKTLNILFLVSFTILAIMNSIDIISDTIFGSWMPLVIYFLLTFIISKDPIKRRLTIILIVFLITNILTFTMLVMINLPFISTTPIGMSSDFSDLISTIFCYIVMFIGINYITLKKESPTINVRNPFIKFIVIYLIIALTALYSILFYYNQKQEQLDLKQLSIILFTSIILIIAVSIRMFRKLHYFFKAENEKNIQLQHYKDQMNFYDTLKENLNELRKIRHDAKHHYHSIYLSLKEGNTASALSMLESILGTVESGSIIPVPGNVMLSTILSLKKQKCMSHNIEFDCNVLVPNLSVTDGDLAIVLGNILDNAIEACQNIKKGRRAIFIYIKTKKKYLEITCENYYSEPLKRKGDIFLTTKSDSKKHGLGLRSVMETAAKNEGYAEFYTRGNIFVSYVILKNSSE